MIINQLNAILDASDLREAITCMVSYLQLVFIFRNIDLLLGILGIFETNVRAYDRFF